MHRIAARISRGWAAGFLLAILGLLACTTPPEPDPAPDGTAEPDTPAADTSTDEPATDGDAEPIAPPVDRPPLVAELSGEGVECFSDAPAEMAGAVMRVFHAALHQLRAIFPPRNPAGATGDRSVAVVLFASHEEFAAYADRFAPENRDAMGYFDPARSSIVLAVQGGATEAERRDATQATMIHEATHLVLREYLGHNYPPAWLDEGLASYFETAHVLPAPDTGAGDEGAAPIELRFGSLHHAMIGRAARVAEATANLRAFCTMPFAQFVRGSAAEVRDRYALAWSLVYFWLNGSDGAYRAAFGAYVREVGDAVDPRMRYPVPFDTWLRVPLPAFEATWRRWIATFHAR